jgi:endonuclease/exonuclease/phosphatase family metal-dependent hydrolase
MKNKAIYIGILIILLHCNVRSQNAVELSVMTWNIRLETPDDGINIWANRKERVTGLILREAPGILCVQEALVSQMNYLKTKLTDYTSAGVGREDGKEKGEFSAVFFNHTMYELLDKGNFWLSKTPEVPNSKDWDAACTRICSWVKLKDIQHKNIFFVFNTHWDHIGVEARTQSASLMISRIKEITGKNDVILCGDFNCAMDSKEIRPLLNATPELRNVRTLCKSEGPGFTYSGFKKGGIQGELIDHIFVTKKIEVKSLRTIDESYEGYYFSDHLPVVAKLGL